MKFHVAAIRVLGLAVSVGFTTSFVNLHGCTQRYSDGTQQAWLDDQQINRVVHQAKPLTLPLSGSIPYAADVTTKVTGRLESPVIGELSGMAVSRNRRDVYWAINDSDNLPELFAIGANGKHLASYTLPLKNRDWEDMASFKDNGESWLLIAETGDNVRHYRTSTLYFLKEPSIPQTRGDADLFRAVSFKYEDGPQNVESVAVSVSERMIFLISKNYGQPKVYALPLDLAGTNGVNGADTAEPHLAKLVGRITPLSWTKEDRWIEKRLASRILLSATSMDISADDTLAVIGNYRHAYLFRRQSDQSWIQALQASPQILSTHRLAQSESVAFSDDGNAIVIGSEGRYAPLLAVSGSVGLAESQ